MVFFYLITDMLKYLITERAQLQRNIPEMIIVFSYQNLFCHDKLRFNRINRQKFIANLGLAVVKDNKCF